MTEKKKAKVAKNKPPAAPRLVLKEVTLNDELHTNPPISPTLDEMNAVVGDMSLSTVKNFPKMGLSTLLVGLAKFCQCTRQQSSQPCNVVTLRSIGSSHMLQSISKH